MLVLSLKKDSPEIAQCRCTIAPFKKKNIFSDEDTFNFCACIATILVYYKTIDGIQDSSFFGGLKYRFALPLVKRNRNKAVKSYPKADEIVAHSIKLQNELESDLCTSSDRACHPTADALGQILLLIQDNQALYHLGYFVGRYIYQMDALDDMEKDLKSKNYNPYIISQKSQEDIRNDINLTIGELINAYELLDLYHFKPILDNILYHGLAHELNQVIANKDGKNKSSTSL